MTLLHTVSNFSSA